MFVGSAPWTALSPPSHRPAPTTSSRSRILPESLARRCTRSRSATSGHRNAGSLAARPCRLQVLYVAVPSVAWGAWSANLEPIFTRCVAAQMPNGPQSCLQSNLPRKPRRKRPAMSLAANRSWGRLARVTGALPSNRHRLLERVHDASPNLPCPCVGDTKPGNRGRC
jgi:hypothetical protein